MYTCRVEVLCHDISVHVPHHVCSKIPWYNLRMANESLRKNWGQVSCRHTGPLCCTPALSHRASCCDAAALRPRLVTDLVRRLSYYGKAMNNSSSKPWPESAVLSFSGWLQCGLCQHLITSLLHSLQQCRVAAKRLPLAPSEHLSTAVVSSLLLSIGSWLPAGTV